MERHQRVVKLLVVDDEPDIVEELCEFLNHSGYICIGCHSAHEAIELFCADPQIGIVLSDLHLPGKDGISLINTLEKTYDGNRQFEAIIFTGQTKTQDVVSAMRAGVADFYQKPINMDEVGRAVRRLERHLQERMDDGAKLDQMNQKLHFLAEPIGELHLDLHQMRSHFGQPELTPAAESAEAIPAHFNQLSPRQLEVARLIGKGLTNYQIACELGITENTVKLYVSQVLRLTHMHNRTQLALALSPSRKSEGSAATAH